jgi:S-adenosylmethionine synthetase
LNLRRPIYRATAAYGHFGRDDIEAPWENTDRAAKLQQAAKAKAANGAATKVSAPQVAVSLAA